MSIPASPLHPELCPPRRFTKGIYLRYRMNRIFSVVRSMTEKIIELSRGVVTAPTPMEQLRSAVARVSESC